MKSRILLLTVLAITAGAGCSTAVAPEPTPTTVILTASPLPEQTPTADGEREQATQTLPREPTTTPQPAPSRTPQREETMTPSSDAEATSELPQVTLAREDLAQRLGLAPGAIAVLEVELRTWPDAGMGCPQPGMVYAQVPQDGLLIRLQVEGQVYDYHSGGTRDPFLCEQAANPQKATPPLDIELRTQPPPSLDE